MHTGAHDGGHVPARLVALDILRFPFDVRETSHRVRERLADVGRGQLADGLCKFAGGRGQV